MRNYTVTTHFTDGNSVIVEFDLGFEASLCANQMILQPNAVKTTIKAAWGSQVTMYPPVIEKVEDES